MEVQIVKIEKMSALHEKIGAALFQACDSDLFPGDILTFTVMERSLNLIRGFCLLLRNCGYTSAVGSLRMQLDNLLRFHGVIMSIDPHEVACLMINGTPLRKIKDKSGKLMTDKRLVEQLSGHNPWVDHVYKLASGYIHLSEHHFYHLSQRWKRNESGNYDISVGDEDDCTSHERKLELIDAFAVITRGVLEAMQQWVEIRKNYTDKEELKTRYIKL